MPGLARKADGFLRETAVRTCADPIVLPFGLGGGGVLDALRADMQSALAIFHYIV